jgi:hypothetical protein
MDGWTLVAGRGERPTQKLAGYYQTSKRCEEETTIKKKTVEEYEQQHKHHSIARPGQVGGMMPDPGARRRPATRQLPGGAYA